MAGMAEGFKQSANFLEMLKGGESPKDAIPHIQKKLDEAIEESRNIYEKTATRDPYIDGMIEAYKAVIKMLVNWQPLPDKLTDSAQIIKEGE